MGQTVAEKENKMRETLRIMSLSRFSYMMANFASEAAHACISSLVLFYAYMVPIWLYGMSDDVLYHESPWTLLVALIFNGLSLVSLSLMMSTFFIDSKVASQIGIFVLYLPCSIFLFSFATVAIEQAKIVWIPSEYLAYVNEGETFYGIYFFKIGYLLPHFSFSIVFLEFLTKGGATLLGFSVATAWITLIL